MRISGLYWLSASASRVDTYIDRVESKSNLADGPSRFDDTLLITLDSTPVKPQIPQAVLQSSVSSWFGSVKITTRIFTHPFSVHSIGAYYRTMGKSPTNTTGGLWGSVPGERDLCGICLNKSAVFLGIEIS